MTIRQSKTFVKSLYPAARQRKVSRLREGYRIESCFYGFDIGPEADNPNDAWKLCAKHLSEAQSATCIGSL